MARYVFTRILEMMSRRGGGLGGCRVLCIGAGYKPDVADTRHSRALHVMQLLAAAGARVEYADRLIPAVEIAGREYKSVTLDVASPADYGLVAVLVSRRGLDLDRFITAGVPVFDAAHALTRHAEGTVERLLARWANTPRGGSHRYFHDPEAFSAIMTDRASGSRTAGLGGGRPRAVSCRRRLGR
jgi:hypothetical protein